MHTNVRHFWQELSVTLLVLSLSTLNCEAVNKRPIEAKSAQDQPAPITDTRNVHSPVLPNVFLETPDLQPPKRKITVSGGVSGAQKFQAALDSATAGDVILLEPGAIYTGNFTLPKKPSAPAGWIIIRSAAPDAALPARGIRITPENAKSFPKLVSPNADAVINAAAGAHHYRFIGIEFTITPTVTQNHGLLVLGSSSQTTLDQLPHDLIIDRCYLHGTATANLTRGIALNCIRGSVIDSHISDCHGQGFEAQAIASWNSPGPFNITNNYLEGSGENVLFGGADPKISGLVPSDIVFRGNTCSKPLSWKPGDPSFAGKRWSVKNIFELKNARRVLIEGNIFENNWVDAQTGVAILFTPRNQEGTAPWTVVEDVTFVNNLVRHVAAAINILGIDDIHPSQQAKRIAIQNNLFEDVNGKKWGGNGVFLLITQALDVTIDHNTILQSGNLITAHGKPSTNFVFTNNLTMHNAYGIIGDGTGIGNSTLDKYFPAGNFKSNVLVGGKKSQYPGDNFFPSQLSEVSLSNHATGDYALTPQSEFKARGTDKKDIGCDMVKLKTALEAHSKNGTSPTTEKRQGLKPAS